MLNVRNQSPPWRWIPPNRKWAILGICLLFLRCPHEADELIGEPAGIRQELLGAWLCKEPSAKKPPPVKMFIMDFDGKQHLAILSGADGERAYMRLVATTFRQAVFLNVEELKDPANHRFTFLRYTVNGTTLDFKILEDPPGRKSAMPHREYLDLLARNVDNPELYSNLWTCDRDASTGPK